MSQFCRIRGAAKFRPITVTDVQIDGRDPALYPDIRLARHMYALQWLPRAIRDDSPLITVAKRPPPHLLKFGSFPVFFSPCSMTSWSSVACCRPGRVKINGI
eukprot:scaffold4536_cov113-Isochrysis_galbana.AAC.3